MNRPNRTPEEEARERRRTARHEAGHAVAALHYGCGIRNISIGGTWPILGTTQLGVSDQAHAVALYAGPFAEAEWDMFPDDPGFLSPGDQQSLDYLGLSPDQSVFWKQETIRFLAKAEVQQQIDRVADALLERIMISKQELVDISQFTVSLADLD